MKIEVLYFRGCPSHHAAVELVRNTVASLGVDADIVEVDVETDEQARQLGFIGSPSIRVDGVDIEPDASADATVGRSCRLYETPDGPSGVPPVKILEASLRK